EEHSPIGRVGASLRLMTMVNRLALGALVGAGFVLYSTDSAAASPAETPTDVAAPTAVETPSTPTPEPSAPAEAGLESPATDASAVPAPPSAATAPGSSASVPEAPPVAESDPAAPTAEEKPREGTATNTETGAESPSPGPEKSNGIDPDLLSGEDEADSAQPNSTARTVVHDPGAYDAALAQAYADEYRPADNPARLHVGARALFANAGGDNEIGGRMGGMQVDVGQAWNHFGYALTGSAWGGRVLMADRVGEMNALFGIGPTITLGRGALQQRGMIDLRLGYDFMYGVVNQRSEDTTIVTSQNDSAFALEQTENLLPHGPRAMLQLGLLSPKRRNYHHGMGVVFGYQGLVGSLRGDLPFTHMLVTGLQWWMG
ncbi:MAG: hypothetical protein KUG77_22155, partial [Nannocystaceae bacterium]|nr:hypothetical protein [Nannocystaceae bacterium]